MATTWAAGAADTVFAGLGTPGLVAAGATQAGQLVTTTTATMVRAGFTVTGQNGATFDPSKVLVGVAEDVDGTAYQTPTKPSEGTTGAAMIPLASEPAQVTSFNGSLLVSSLNSHGFRFVVQNENINPAPVGIIVVPTYAKGT